MSKKLLVTLVVAVLSVCLLAAAAVYFVLPLLKEWSIQPHGMALVYEIDRGSSADAKKPDAKKVDMAELIEKINARLNSVSRTAGVKQLPGRRIEVTLFSTDAAVVENVDGLVQCDGNLEFRILTNRRDDKPLIDRALADPTKSKILDDKGAWLARWVLVKSEEARALAGDADIAVRQKKTDGREVTEALVNNDDYDVTGTYIKHASPGVDSQGRPCVRIQFDKHGSELLGLITVSRLPNEATRFTCRLGIVLDGELQAAPKIQATIHDAAEITGSFTKQDAENLASVLNSGKLPVKLKRVTSRP
jgi:preprotein translocase subunit SecD